MSHCKHTMGKPCGLCGHDPRPLPVVPLSDPPGCTPFAAIAGLIDNAVASCREEGGGADARMDLAAELIEIATSILAAEVLKGSRS